MADIVLVNPRFEVSYWGLEHALPYMGKRANLPTACLPLLAALTPGEHSITLIDENVEAIDFQRLARADIVGLTGMSVQRHRMLEILRELKSTGVFTVVGGPWVTVREDYFAELADVIFIGEAEETWPRFLRDWADDRHVHRYEQAERTDMTTVPVPRTDLLKTQHYLFGSLQFSRGCPFQCEFCDIIVTFGRRPRLKLAEQVIREVEALAAQGFEIAFIVDDNLIGNKRGIKPVIARLAEWQREHGFPFTFFTEASLDLADDAELMQLMVDANITSVFVGIESPNEASLAETKKLQNLRPGGTLVEKVRTIQDAGMEVWCGLILGFDHDDATIFDAHLMFLEEARILHAMPGMLAAIPKTPLHARLAAEGRLDEDDLSPFGTNVIPTCMTRTELRDGYIALVEKMYSPESFFERVEGLYLRDGLRFGETRRKWWYRHPLTWIKDQATYAVRAAVLYWRLTHQIPERKMRDEYRRRLRRAFWARPDPLVLFVYAIKCAMHYHHYTMAQNMKRNTMKLVNSF
jgi:radical SAM superfamily enzyme YgiQ (UPF0313 family)